MVKMCRCKVISLKCVQMYSKEEIHFVSLFARHKCDRWHKMIIIYYYYFVKPLFCGVWLLGKFLHEFFLCHRHQWRYEYITNIVHYIYIIYTITAVLRTILRIDERKHKKKEKIFIVRMKWTHITHSSTIDDGIGEIAICTKRDMPNILQIK